MKTLLRSDELSCPSCISKIEKALGRIDGVTRAKVHFSTGRIEVEHDADGVDPEQLRTAVREIGYETRVSAF